PSLSTTANSSSSVAGSPYPISPALGTLSAINYEFTFIDGTLTITSAALSNSLISGANPCLPGSNVTFTATLSALGGGTPAGAVQFMVDGSPLGPPVQMIDGAASLTTSSLLHGTNIIAAQYAGDGNFLGSTNQLQQIINTTAV